MDRAQFLQGLRTGGPRSASYTNPPLSANPATARFASNSFQQQQQVQFDESALTDRFGNINLGANVPMSAGPGELGPRLQAQQQLILLQAQAQVAAMLAQQGGGPVAEAQAMQLQMEVMRLQAVQQQQNFQAQLLLQQQLLAQQQQQQQQARRASEQVAMPSTAGPLSSSSFADQQTRSNVANQLRARAAGREAAAANNSLRASASDDQVAAAMSPPMTAGVNGKFGVGMGVNNNRAVSSPLNPNAAAFVGKFSANPDLSLAIAAATAAKASNAAIGEPATPTYGATTVISGGTSLGGPASPVVGATPSNSYNGLSGYNNTAATGAPTKSDSATSWRRGSTPITTKAPSPPLRQRSTSPPQESPVRVRPSPLRFGRADSPSGSLDGNDNASIGDGSSKASPTSSTPPSSAGSVDIHGGNKKYEGIAIGLGRPAPTAFNPNAAPFALNTANLPLPTLTTTAPTPVVSKVEPVRQPMGPPGSVDELGAANFASRMRKKALGGLMEARERREMASAVY